MPNPEKKDSPSVGVSPDHDSEFYLARLEERERTRSNHIPGVQKVLVILSAAGMVYDTEALRQKITLSYPTAAVFFRTTDGKPLGITPPKKVDLLIDLTGPGQRQGWFYALKLKRISRVTVGRNAGLFRKRAYDRIFDEKAILNQLPQDVLERERFVQRQVCALAGAPFLPAGDATPDRAKMIALELPPLARF